MTTDRKRDVEHDFQIDSALKGIMDFSPIGIAVFSHDTSLLYANPLAERLFDKQMPEAVGLRCGDFIGCARRLAEPQGCGPTRHCPACPFDHAICAACSDEPAMAIREGEAFLERKAGLPSMWVKYKVSGLAVKARKVAIMTVDDITRQKEDEQQLRHSLTELSVIHEHAPVVMMLVDRDRRVQRVNGFAAKFADRPSDEMIGLRGGEALRCLHHLDDPQGCGFGPACAQCLVREAVLDAFETGLSQRDVEAWLPFPQGESSIDRCLIISTAYLKIGDSERVIVCSQDITDRKRAEEEREKLQARMAQAQKMESIGTLAGGIAHDFNNILSIIVGNTEMAMLDVPDWSPAQDNLKEVREATLRARDLVKQILMFARQKEHTVSNIRLEPVARESLKMLRASIPTMVEIREDIEEHLPSVLADPSQIQQIIINLCTNAGQVMEAEGGALTVTLDSAVLEAPLHTMVQELPPGRYVRMQVKDTGPGIPAENMERVFDPFFTTKGVGEGTGLGLAVVYGIVQDRHGGITVESEEGRGTTFTVYLPASDVESVEVKTEQKRELPRGNERILFVDDEPMIMKLGQRMLEKQGYIVQTRASGTDALECFRQDPHGFDLVVTDMTMPGMRGDRLAEEIMAIRPDIPVILSTGYSKQISNEKAREIGIRAFVMKPLTQQELANTVREVLDEQPQK